MRNLKRVLSLALALVMMLGMMIIGASAASTQDFADKAEITNDEAVEVLVALGVIEGDDKGNFNPDATLTREQAAKIICYMLMGPENAEKLSKNTTIFTDVAAGRWSAGYIAYCANLGILAGYGDGTFGPEDKLTGVAFGKMLLVALGYDATVEGYVGKNWATEIATDMIDAGIDVDGVAMDAPLSRDNACQMAFQTLTANMVKYDNKGSNITIGDITINQGAAEAEAVTRDETTPGTNYAGNSGTSGYGYQQFCEKYFKTLKKAAGVSDDFGRPASHSWKLGTKTIYNATATPVATFTAKASASAIAKELNGYKLVNGDDSYKVNDTYTITGDAAVFTGLVDGGNLTVAVNDTVANAIAGLTANGKLVEVYANRDSEITEIVTVAYNTYTVQSVTTDKKTGDVTYKINNVNYKDYADDEVSEDTIVLNGSVSKGDVVTTVSAGSKLYVYPTVSFEGTQTAFKTVQGVRNLTIDGETYKVGAYTMTAVGDYTNSKTAASYSIDQYGFIVAREAINNASTDYAYVVGVLAKKAVNFDGTTPSLQARVVLADGTVAEYNVALEKTANGAYNDYSIKGISGVIYNTNADQNETAIANAANTALADKVFGYTVEDGVITFEDLDDLPVSGTAAETYTVYGTNLGTLNHAYASYTVNSDKYVTVGDNTVFVAYNSTTNKTTVYTGRSALPTALDLASATGYAALKTAAAANVGTAQVVFFTVASNLSADATNNYVYVNTNDTTTIMVNGKNEVHYTGYAADGTTVDLVAGTPAPSAGGLYIPTKDGKISGSPVSGTRYVDATTDKVQDIGNGMIRIGANFYYVTDETNVIYVDSRLSELNDNKAWVVLTVNGGTPTTTVETIFVIAD